MMLDSFWTKVEKTTMCWNWNGAVDYKGYGRVRIDQNGVSKTRIAHRIAYELVHGAIPKGLTIDHLCRNRRCVNPHHLEAVPNKVNVLRGVGPTAINAGKTHCIRGHELKGKNLYRRKAARVCAICYMEFKLRWRRQRAAANRPIQNNEVKREVGESTKR